MFVAKSKSGKLMFRPMLQFCFFVCSLRNSAVLQVSVIRMLGGEKVFDLILMNIFQMVSALAV